MTEKCKTTDHKKWAYELIDQLEKYEELSNSEIENCEYDRTQLAHAAVSTFWKIYGGHMIWAENYIRGRIIVFDQPKLQECLSEIIDFDRDDEDYPFEDVGSLFGWNGRKGFLGYTSEIIETAAAAYQRGEWEYSLRAQRELYIQMSATRLGDAWWLKETRSAYESVQIGAKPPVFEPEKKVHGDPEKLHHAKFLAVAHVRLLCGAGSKKLDARLEVGEKIGISEASLKSWEAEICKTEYDAFSLYACECNGYWGKETLDQMSRDEMFANSVESFHGTNNLELAKYYTAVFEKNPLDVVRKLLNEARK